MAKNNSGGSSLIGFLLGGLVGAVIGVLIAPRAGSETRADLVARSEAWKSTVEKFAAEMRERSSPAVDNLKEGFGPAVDNVIDRVVPVVDQALERLTPVVERASSKIGGGHTVQTNGEYETEPVDVLEEDEDIAGRA